MFLESDLAPLATRVAAQQTTLDSLTRELEALHAELAKAAGAGQPGESHPEP